MNKLKVIFITLILINLPNKKFSQSENTRTVIIRDEEAANVGKYFDIEIDNLSINSDTTLNFELIPNLSLQSGLYTTLIEKLKRETHNDGRFENTTLELWERLPIPVYIPEYSRSHFGVDIDFKLVLMETIQSFEDSVNAYIRPNNELNLFEVVESEINNGNYGIDVSFTHPLTWIQFCEWNWNEGAIPTYAHLHLRNYLPADSLGNIKTEKFDIEIKNALYSLLINGDGNSQEFWGRKVKFFRTQSNNHMNEDIVGDLSGDEFKLLALVYSLDKNSRNLSYDINEINNSPFANAGQDLVVMTQTPVALDGSNSFDLDYDELTFLWKQNGGPKTTMNDSTSPIINVILPRFDNYTYELTVQDVHGAHSSDLVQISAYSVAPIPQPVETLDNIIVATYYLTGWGKKNHWPPDINNGDRSTDFTLGFSTFNNLLGNYDTADPKVADWHIKMALENGVNTFLIPNGRPAAHWAWEQNFEDGLLKSQYFNMINFAMMFNTEPWWGSESLNQIISIDDLIDETISYYVSNYFNYPNYLKINGNPVVVLYHMWIHEDNFGVEQSLEYISKIREAASNYGVNLFLIGDVMRPVLHNDNVLTQMVEACDAVSSYAMWSAGTDWRFKNGVVYLEAPYEENLQGYLDENDYYSSLCNNSGKIFIPPATIGADTRNMFLIGRDNSYIYHTNPSPLKFGQSLEDLKSFLNPTVKMVIIYAWNEYHEANILEPTEKYGYQYLEQVRNTFGIQPQNGWPINIWP